MSDPKPLAIDLCCGDCTWSNMLLAYGWRVIGVDIVKSDKLPPSTDFTFIQCDVRKFLEYSHLASLNVNLVIGSAPCDEFSRFKMPWTRAKNPPQPDCSIVDAIRRIAIHFSCPLVMENVETAQKWIGKAERHFGPFYLWGDGIPALLPKFNHGRDMKKKESYGSKRKLQRAAIPKILAAHVAGYHAQLYWYSRNSRPSRALNE